MPSIVVVGHSHQCPVHGRGAVTTGTAGPTSNGRDVARVGDRTSCGATIISGCSALIVDGQPVACAGDRTDHGGVLIEGEDGFRVE